MKTLTRSSALAVGQGMNALYKGGQVREHLCQVVACEWGFEIHRFCSQLPRTSTQINVELEVPAQFNINWKDLDLRRACAL